MTTVYVATVICDHTGCMARAETRGGLAAVRPDGWRHVPGLDGRKSYMSRPSRDYCPQHAAEHAAD